MYYVRHVDGEHPEVTCEACGLSWVPHASGFDMLMSMQRHRVLEHGAPRCAHEVSTESHVQHVQGTVHVSGCSEAHVSGSECPMHERCERPLDHPGSCVVWHEKCKHTAAMREEQKRRLLGGPDLA